MISTYESNRKQSESLSRRVARDRTEFQKLSRKEKIIKIKRAENCRLKSVEWLSPSLREINLTLNSSCHRRAPTTHGLTWPKISDDNETTTTSCIWPNDANSRQIACDTMDYEKQRKNGRGLILRTGAVPSRQPLTVDRRRRSPDATGRLRGVRCRSVMLSATTWCLYQRSMAFISLRAVGSDLRLETRTIHGRCNEKDWRESRAAWTSKDRRATGVNMTSGRNPSGGLLGDFTGLLPPHLPTHTFARQVHIRTHIYMTSGHVRTRAFSVAFSCKWCFRSLRSGLGVVGFKL